jgi:hypothetical protein
VDLGFFSNLNKGIQDQTHVAVAHLYIQHAIIPIIDKLASEEHIDSKHELKNMIRKQERLRDYANDPRFRKKLRGIIHYPGVNFAFVKFRGHLESSDVKILNSVPWWMARLKETNPSLYTAIDSESEGRLWFGKVLVDLVALLREYL